ncbi:MAG: class I SAM-dependent methyltransferase, partial [Clostridia bacterium]|nr:class I SAM-dependent methyltransferase [Clostridia bacterium]
MNLDFEKLIELSKKPDIFTPGDSFLWTDPHIAGQMLKTHLDPSTDSASRKPETIDDTVEFCIRRLGLKAGNSVLDAGCGPGLYCERFVKKGLEVSGLDISSNSIAYARRHASENGLDIKYICGNYLDMD